MKLDYVCFNITSLCNMACPYCYRVGNSLGSIHLSTAKKYIDLLQKYGCRTINITGGEPLLNKYWREIVKYCKQNGMFVILSTNGANLDLNDNALTNIDVLSLPLDGATAEINKQTRARGHFEAIQKLLSCYSTGDYTFSLKINTVITKYNVTTLQNIREQIDFSGVVWKLFELRPKGMFYNFPDCGIAVSNEILCAVKELQQGQSNCKICFMGKSSDSAITTVNANYIVLNYNGDVYIASENEDALLTNLDEDNATAIINDLVIREVNNQYQEELKDDFITN